jgi:hypothetical protein
MEIIVLVCPTIKLASAPLSALRIIVWMQQQHQGNKAKIYQALTKVVFYSKIQSHSSFCCQDLLMCAFIE